MSTRAISKAGPNLGVYLRCTPKSFQQIKSLQQKNSRIKEPRPSNTLIKIFHSIPHDLRSSLHSKLGELASRSSPIKIETGAPRIAYKYPAVDGHQSYHGVAFPTSMQQSADVRGEILSTIKDDKTKIMNYTDVFVQGLRTDAEAKEALAALKQELPNGAGTLVVDGFVLKNEGGSRVAQEASQEVFPFGEAGRD